MPSLDSLQAFVFAADLGSFSAAARRMRKAQSAVSTAIANLEIDTGLQLFDRSTRSPTLTHEGETLLPYARGVLMGNQELMAKATSMTEDLEDRLCLAVEQGLNLTPVLDSLDRFAAEFPTVSLELLSTGPNDTADLLKAGRADLGVMSEQENYPIGFQFRGVGYTKLVPVCGKDHALAALDRIAYRDLRQHRQLVYCSQSSNQSRQVGVIKSAQIWQADDPETIADLVKRGLGWAELPLPVVRQALAAGQLVRMKYTFQQSDDFEGVDVVWTEKRGLGQAGHWLQAQLLKVPQDIWES